MVRIYVTSNNVDLPMDFSPEEARSIADEVVHLHFLAEKLFKMKNNRLPFLWDWFSCFWNRNAFLGFYFSIII